MTRFITENDYLAYAARIKADYAAFGSSNMEVQFDYGSTYTRVVTCTCHGQRSAHSFIVTKAGKWPLGTILKCAGWKGPAQNFARGNIFDLDKVQVRWTGF